MKKNEEKKKIYCFTDSTNICAGMDDFYVPLTKKEHSIIKKSIKEEWEDSFNLSKKSFTEKYVNEKIENPSDEDFDITSTKCKGVNIPDNILELDSEEIYDLFRSGNCFIKE